MDSLKEMCQIVDNFVADGLSNHFESSEEFWQELSYNQKTAQMYTECLIYKYIALTYGLGERALFPSLNQIKNIAAPSISGPGPSAKAVAPDTTPGSSPRGSLTTSGSSYKSKRSSGNYDKSPPDAKGTPKKKYIARRKSEDSKKQSRKNDLEYGYEGSGRRKSNKMSAKNSNSMEVEDVSDKVDKEFQTCLEKMLLSLNYMSKMCDLTEWDFSKLREVFLTWNKARGWEQNASDYEYSVMKRFSLSPSSISGDEEQYVKTLGDILSSCSKKRIGEAAILENRKVGESIKYWEIRHKILTRPEESVSVIKCLILLAKKILEQGDESKIIPLLHLFCESVIMSTHTPLELLQECYSTFELFYVWPRFVAHPIKEVLDMIQLEMKCPGHFFRMIFCQDNEINLAAHLKAKMPRSETHVFVDENVPHTNAISEAFGKLCGSTELDDENDKFRYVIRHIYESVFGTDCCDMATLDTAMQACPVEEIPILCYEGLGVMEKASMMNTHGEAQDFLRNELDLFSDRLVDFIDEAENSGGHDTKNSMRSPSCRRVSVLLDSCRIRDLSSPSRTLLKSAQGGIASPRRNNSYLRRTSSGTLDNDKTTKKSSMKSSPDRKIIPSQLLGSKVVMNTFDHNDLSETIFQLVRNSAKSFMREKKRSVGTSFKRKRDSSHFDSQEASRDSGVIEDDYNGISAGGNVSFKGTISSLTTAVQHIRIEEGSEKPTTTVIDLQQTKSISPISISSEPEDTAKIFANLAEQEDSDSFWREFSEHGFGSTEDMNLEELLKSMTLNQRKSFLLEKSQQLSLTKEANLGSYGTERDESTSNELSMPSIAFAVRFSEDKNTFEQTEYTSRPDVTENQQKKSSRISQFRRRGMRFVHQKRRSSRKKKGDCEQKEKLSSAESLSSTPSSTTSEESNDLPVPRYRTTSDPIYRKRRRGKLNKGDVTEASPIVQKNTRDTLSIDAAEQSLNLSVRSLPGKKRVSLFASDAFDEAGIGSNTRERDIKYESKDCCTQKNSIVYPPTSPNEIFEGNNKDENNFPSSRKNIHFKIRDDGDDVRQRIDSGIGQENNEDYAKRRILSSMDARQEQEDLGVAGVKFAMRETLKASRRNRLSVGDYEERSVQKQVLKLVFVGNDKTLSHVARAYYELRKRQTSRAPLFQHVDLRLYFIPVSSNQFEKEDVVQVNTKSTYDVRFGELLGTFDSWYHTVVMLSVNNLLRVYPKVFSLGGSMDGNENSEREKDSTRSRLLAPQEVIANTLLSYTRFAVSVTNINVYKVSMVNSSGDTLTDIFCSQLEIGHGAYTKAVKAGRFGKLGKLVDLSNDSGPPPAYCKIEYSKWSIDGTLIYTGKLDETFYHNVYLTPMPLIKEHYRGRDVLNLFLLDNERKPKNVRRTSNNKLASMEEMEQVGTTLNIGNLKMEVTRPTQGTFAVLLDDCKIYTSIKSIEVVPCPAPEIELLHQRKRNISRRMRENQLLRLPVRTFWQIS